MTQPAATEYFESVVELYNQYRVHSGIGGITPEERGGHLRPGAARLAPTDGNFIAMSCLQSQQRLKIPNRQHSLTQVSFTFRRKAPTI